MQLRSQAFQFNIKALCFRKFKTQFVVSLEIFQILLSLPFLSNCLIVVGVYDGV